VTLERDRLAPQPGGRSHGPLSWAQLTHIAQSPHNGSHCADGERLRLFNDCLARGESCERR
jgi:hypothetical protein